MNWKTQEARQKSWKRDALTLGSDQVQTMIQSLERLYTTSYFLPKEMDSSPESS